MTSFVSKSLNYLWLHGWKYRAMERLHRQQERQLQLQENRPLRVVFMAIDVALWRYQHLYELMAADERFLPTIVLSPCIGRQKEEDAAGLRHYFDKRGISYIDYKEGEPPYDIRGKLNPDIIFFCQPYEHLLRPEHDCLNFYDCLLCYMPYAFWSSKGKLSYDLHFHNMAWRLYYSTQLHLAEAQRTATNHGRNVRVVGYANADDYLMAHHDSSVWKTMSDGRQRKRIIWAPHFSIMDVTGFMPRSNFLWMADVMVRLARDYHDEIQIAFKPHPALLTQLYRHQEWGQAKADEYYALWQAMDNTQLETGQFIDLFMTSDAMIHDSGSFAVEYHYSRKPVMFVSKDIDAILSTQSDFGKKAYGLHYIGKDEADIRRFIDQHVLAGDDPLLPLREQFFTDHLLPPGGKSVAQNIIDDIVESLKL